MVDVDTFRSHVAAGTATVPPATSPPRTTRVSMEEYYEQRSASIDIPEVEDSEAEAEVEADGEEDVEVEEEAPPAYDALLLAPTLSRKYNIQPREDEGREILPAYSSEISLETVFLRKMELEGAVHRAHDRNWNRVFATLQGTALSFHQYKGAGPFQMLRDGSHHTADMPPGSKRGCLLKSYNLQHADVGIAADYFKKRYVIRVRAETDQFLLSCVKIETFVLWLQSLFAAIDLAPPLDDREIPRDLSIPRPRRRRRAAALAAAAMERDTALIREQEEIMRTQFPRLAEWISEDSSASSTDSTSAPAVINTAAPASYEEPPQPLNPNIVLVPRIRRPHTRLGPIASASSLQELTGSTPNPSIVPETGKWRPEHQWTPFYDMQYARRCMAILTCRSPRKSNFVIMRGKQWVVDWATGAITRWEPPTYGEVVGSAKNNGSAAGGAHGREGGSVLGGKGGLRVGRYGDVIAVG